MALKYYRHCVLSRRIRTTVNFYRATLC